MREEKIAMIKMLNMYNHERIYIFNNLLGCDVPKNRSNFFVDGNQHQMRTYIRFTHIFYTSILAI